MIDIHHHLLWDMDDGATSVEDSIAMAKRRLRENPSDAVCSSGDEPDGLLVGHHELTADRARRSRHLTAVERS